MIGLGVPSTVVALGAVGLMAAFLRWAHRDKPGQGRTTVARTDAFALSTFGLGLPEILGIVVAIVVVVLVLRFS